MGGHLSQSLLTVGCEVVGLDKDVSAARDAQINLTGLRDRIKVVEADITDLDAIRKIVIEGNFDFIFAVAAGAAVIEKAVQAPYDTILANTMGFVNVCECVRLLPEAERPVVIYSSTDKVYGETEVLPYTEDSGLGGVGVYDSAKLAADIFARMYHHALGVPTIVLRLCNLFGPYDFNTDYRLIPKALRNIFRDGSGPELYSEALEHFRDYIYVEDAVRAFLMVAEFKASRGRVYNLPGIYHAATPDVINVLIETVNAMQEDAQKRDPSSGFANLKWSRQIRIVPSDPKPIVISKQHLDGSRIHAEVGFKPEISFRDGLINTIKFYERLFLQDSKSDHNKEEIPVSTCS